jgi:hypothetical protein
MTFSTLLWLALGLFGGPSVATLVLVGNRLDGDVRIVPSTFMAIIIAQVSATLLLFPAFVFRSAQVHNRQIEAARAANARRVAEGGNQMPQHDADLPFGGSEEVSTPSQLLRLSSTLFRRAVV